MWKYPRLSRTCEMMKTKSRHSQRFRNPQSPCSLVSVAHDKQLVPHSIRVPCLTSTCTGVLELSDVVSIVMKFLLSCLDWCSVGAQAAAYRAAKSGWETAIFDCWGRHRNVAVHELVGIAKGHPDGEYCRVSFYTAALNDDIAAMIASAKLGWKFTPHLKVKLNADVGRCCRVLRSLASAAAELFPSTAADCGEHDRIYWSIDANCAWSPQVALEFLPAIRDFPYGYPIDATILMIEQPFPADLLDRKGPSAGITDAYSMTGWHAVKAAYEAIG